MAHAACMVHQNNIMNGTTKSISFDFCWSSSDNFKLSTGEKFVRKKSLLIQLFNHLLKVADTLVVLIQSTSDNQDSQSSWGKSEGFVLFYLMAFENKFLRKSWNLNLSISFSTRSKLAKFQLVKFTRSLILAGPLGEMKRLQVITTF